MGNDAVVTLHAYIDGNNAEALQGTPKTWPHWVPLLRSVIAICFSNKSSWLLKES